MNVRRLSCLFAVAVLAAAAPALAAIAVGTQAPTFTLQATKGGKVFTFDLAAALKKGPVVLYFYPAAFTPGCTLEAHAFAEAIPQYTALGATVIGVSRDNLDKLQKFSVSECRSKFAVAADTAGTVTKSFDVPLPQDPSVADRTSFVIAPDGKIIYEFTDLVDPEKHVTNTLDALKQWEAANPKPAQ
ncbi:MAG: peroxiredoxin [Candidatus Eremiobacteraeota bacterium]|nr:peroxiredoxin [Candidatus Eremiobacteraeota bacterium]